MTSQPRVSFDNIVGWNQLKADYSQALYTRLDQRVKDSGLEDEKEALAAHVKLVRPFSLCFEGSDVMFASISSGRSQRRRRTSASMDGTTRI